MKRLLIIFVVLSVIALLAIPALINWISPARIEKSGTMVHMYSHESGQLVSLPVDEYVIGVVAAEMPAEFPEEALKAQAVAARTYIMKRLTGGGVSNPIHPGADVCDDHRHYQGWISREEMKKRWGPVKYYQYYFKVAMAVYATGNEVITYGGQLIDPVYFSSCGGAGTISAGDVWKVDDPYLRAVPCPYDADPEPSRVATFSPEQIKAATGVDISALPASTGYKSLFAVLEKTSGGEPKTVRLGNKVLSAVALREKLGLRSARLSVSMEDGMVKITTRGYGHGVGMCQYGAKGMAIKKNSYREILKYYYSGVEISEM